MDAWSGDNSIKQGHCELLGSRTFAAHLQSEAEDVSACVVLPSHGSRDLMNWRRSFSGRCWKIHSSSFPDKCRPARSCFNHIEHYSLMPIPMLLLGERLIRLLICFLVSASLRPETHLQALSLTHLNEPPSCLVLSPHTDGQREAQGPENTRLLECCSRDDWRWISYQHNRVIQCTNADSAVKKFIKQHGEITTTNAKQRYNK